MIKIGKVYNTSLSSALKMTKNLFILPNLHKPEKMNGYCKPILQKPKKLSVRYCKPHIYMVKYNETVSTVKKVTI